MRLREIKPGVVIHCKNDTEYEQLNAKVIKLGYGRLPFEKRNLLGQVNNVVFCLGTDEICWNYVGDFNGEYIEFSDLIIPEMSAEEAYNKGMNDAWELAKKILYGIDKQLIEIFKLNVQLAFFDLTHKRAIINDYTPQEALAKIEDYEKEQAEIKVGDVVYADDDPDSFGVVTWINKKLVYVMWNDGSCGSDTRLEELHKKGRHIDIESLLKQMGE